MSEEKKDELEENETSHPKHKCKRNHCGKRGRCGRAVFGVLAIVGVVWLAGALFGPGCGYAGWHHGGHHWSQADITERMDRMTDHLIDHVDASQAQGEQIKAIVNSYAPRLQATKTSHLDNRSAFTRALTQPSVDRSELEAVRQSELALLNSNSQELVQMIADIADVLTPEQRQELASDVKERFHHSR
ncbi:periplasmic heavy metal sensor [Mariprofundus sp. NF]|uniref:Spy/CpxP family protein refolding chaperone n=1 Tax=Mariprofundus sp. NF TaxID=2608716 RepID=UPI0015A2BC20|nr:periplasmic heavy metal sensor [Mariprofundus sp. NF]NWF39769.1 periplasmic heavy metal sensor [Mariprofundus sp. NF]